MRISDWSSDVCSSDLLMTYVEINPYWNVPPSIARDELLPKIKQDASYLAKHNYVLFSDWSSGAAVLDPQSIDWTQVSGASFPYKIRQDAGDGNALGRLKVMFPHRFNLDLHDTPAKALFSRAERRSDERRVGKECVSTGRSRCSPYIKKKKK